MKGFSLVFLLVLIHPSFSLCQASSFWQRAKQWLQSKPETSQPTAKEPVKQNSANKECCRLSRFDTISTNQEIGTKELNTSTHPSRK